MTPAAGNGIYSDQGLVKATINKNFFTLHENTSVILIGFTPGAVSNVGVNQNEIIDDGTIILAGATDSSVNDNTSENSNSNGIQFGFGGGTAAFGVTNTEVISSPTV